MEILLGFGIITVVYAVFILKIFTGIKKLPTFNLKNSTPTTGFSIIIPIRNEAKNLPKLLESIAQLNYPAEQFEVIIIDDFSEDNSERIYLNWRLLHSQFDTTFLENVRRTGSPKKDAISRALPILKHSWVITTDGDCILPKNWLQAYNDYIQETNKEMVAGPVILKTKNNWFHDFQQLETLALQGTTIGSFGNDQGFMCNGANFAYTKALFLSINGFEGTTHYAGGDDVFLLQKGRNQHPEKVGYLKSVDALVKTRPIDDLFAVIQQRIRWAAKSTGYANSYAKGLAVVVLLMNVSWVAAVTLAFNELVVWPIVWGVWAVKYAVDFALLYRTNAFLRQGKFFLPLASSVLYPFFSSITGICALFGGFQWKGRSFKR
ncbi:MAG: hypothetical protein RL607_2395 [Bacteroidota bacterium]|jgi:glycosyltransferase involved in cell wall biosynthesis